MATSPRFRCAIPERQTYYKPASHGKVAGRMSMSRAISRLACASVVAGILGAASVLSGQGSAAGQPSTKNGEWPHYTADLKGTRYSPLDQINAANFNKLEVAWHFKTDNLGPFPEYK